MKICTESLFDAARHRGAIARPLAVALMMSVALPAVAAAATLSNGAQDLGAVDAATPMTATVWLKGHNAAAFDAAVADRYDPKSPSYHVWMSLEQVANFGPTPGDIAKLTVSLRGQGLKIERVTEDGAAIKVSGTADRVQAAFGTPIHKGVLDGRSVLANLAEPRYQGANAELVDAVTGLSTSGMHPFVLRQADLSTGAPRAGVRLADTSNPLAAFTDNCFGGKISQTLSGPVLNTAFAGKVTTTFAGPQYLPTGAGTTNQPPCGYTVEQLAAHYGLDAVHAKGWTGKGETIVIVDAYGSPTIVDDANVFSKLMGLSPLTNANFQVVFPDGPPKTALTDPQLLTDWSVETSLDVEWAHAVAPDAKIVLLVAPSQDDDEFVFALSYATLHKLGNVISNSYGASEVATGSVVARNYNSTIKKAAAEGIAVNFASGDSGDNGVGSPLGAAGVPADSPFATAVGGTSIGVPSDQGPIESAWGETFTSLGTSTQPSYPLLPTFAQGSGGGESVYLAKPGFQKQLPGLGRQTPDVSALADPLTGAIIVWNAQATVIGGTSLATPIFSALWTLANQAAGQSLGQAAPILAKMTSNAIQDVLPIVASAKNTSGTIALKDGAPTSESPADFLGLASTQPEGFIGTIIEAVSIHSFFRPAYTDIGFGADSSLTATVGWDSATGWGVPKGLPFIKEAIKHAKPNS